MSKLEFQIGETIKVFVNGEESKATIFGYELGWWLDPNDWLITFSIDQFPFTLKATQTLLTNGCHISCNGIVAKVLNDAKVKAK